MTEDATRRIAAIIVQTAVDDWKLLKKRNLDFIHYEKEQYDISSKEILQFLNSTWMDTLMEILELDGDKILEKLLNGDNDYRTRSSIRPG